MTDSIYHPEPSRSALVRLLLQLIPLEDVGRGLSPRTLGLLGLSLGLTIVMAVTILVVAGLPRNAILVAGLALLGGVLVVTFVGRAARRLAERISGSPDEW